MRLRLRLVPFACFIALWTLCATSAASSANTAKHPIKIAAKTEVYSQKEGFHKEPKDIINTLKTIEITQFQNMLDGLQQGFDLDKTLKDKGPFTVFAAPDKAFKHMADEDFQNLFGNKVKLKQVMAYHIVPGKYGMSELKSAKTLKTLEGHDVTVADKNGTLFVDNAMITTCDIPCSNGVMHIIDKVIMPPLAK